MPRNLYFIDNVYRAGGDDNPSGGYVTLINTKPDKEGRYLPMTLLFKSQLSFPEGRLVEEDNFVILVRHRTGENPVFRDANDTPEAIRFAEEAAQTQAAMQELSKSSETSVLKNHEKEILAGDCEVYSYHVNVGHGNCSLILISGKKGYILWMVDCSALEGLPNSRKCIRHYRDLDICIQDIAQKVRTTVDRLKISRFFLTHLHYDHYNGMFYLRKKGLIDNTTIYYINLFLSCKNPAFTKLLNNLNTSAVVKEPIAGAAGNLPLTILHPEYRIYRKGDPKAKHIVNKIEVKNVNNASVVYNFMFGGRSMVFPGDLEKDGFDAMTKSRKCASELNASLYYVVSHHGSINGHPDFPCFGTKVYPTPLSCLSCGLQKALLLGRDKAFPTIFDPSVISFFKGLLVTTDRVNRKRPLKYFRLRWSTGSVYYRY